MMEFYELALSVRIEIIDRITEVLRDEFDMSPNSINAFWHQILNEEQGEKDK